MNVNIKKKILDSIISEYNQDSINQELEIIYKQHIEDNILIKILQFIIKKYNNNPSYTNKININNLKTQYILDIFIDNISKFHRLSYKSNEDLIQQHCVNEKNNIDNQTFPDDYILEYKKLINKYNIDDLNSKINLKNEYIESDSKIKEDFIKNYNKFVKFYRYKKRYTIDFNNYSFDISIIKQAKGNNIILSNITQQLEQYEIEVEFKNNSITTNLLIDVLQNFIIPFKQFNNNSYFITNDSNYKTIINAFNKLKEPNKINKYKQIGPKPVSLTKKNIKYMLLSHDLTSKLDKPPNNIYYKITEKADGERYFMFIDKDGFIYLINNNNNVILTGLKLNINIPNHKNFINSIIDGEYLYYKNQSNKYIYNYRYFDIYFKESIKIFNTPLDNRIQLMNELHNILNSDEIIKYIDPTMFISCHQKEYYNVSEINTIMNINKYPYHIDGIIFMPTIPLQHINDITYNEILKYKDISENTIDVFVQNKTLYCGYNLFINKNKTYILSELFSIKPYLYNLSTPDFIYDNSFNPIDWNKLDNKIIEIKYDNSSDKFIFNKIRYDKTFKYNTTKQITANNFNIVNDIISYNFNPIDINTFNNFTTQTINDIHNLNNTSHYYKTDNNNKSDIRKINNSIKKQLIDYSIDILETLQDKLPDFNYIKVMDLACGRGGDLKKYIDTNFYPNSSKLKKNGGIQFILGIDNDPVNIEFYDDKNSLSNNARARYISYKNNHTHIHNPSDYPNIYKNNSVYYITGDLNQYDNTLDRSIEDTYKKIMEKEYDDFPDRYNYDKKLLDNINTNYYEYFNLYQQQQFELISCQFAIHYFNLDYFSHFVDLHLKNYGLFICTFMEKNYVLELLGSNESVSGDFWSLKKSPNPDKIYVKFETLDEDFKEENLVSKEQIISQFSKYSIKPYVDTYTKVATNRKFAIESHFDFKQHSKLKFNSDKELDFSKLYSYLILQKDTDPDDRLQSILQNI